MSLKDAIARNRMADVSNPAGMRSFVMLLVEETVLRKMEELNKVITDEVVTAVEKELGERILQIEGPKGENGKDGVDGKDGYTPIKGVDYFDGKDGRDGKDGKTLSKEELKDIITPLIPEPKHGRDGKDGSPDTPDQIVEKINKSEKFISPQRIDGFNDTIMKMKDAIRNATKGGGGGGGGMGTIKHESFAISSATTTVTLAHNVAAGGNAIWAYYNGQSLVKDTSYSISGKTITLLFTPLDSTYIDVTYVRA